MDGIVQAELTSLWQQLKLNKMSDKKKPFKDTGVGRFLIEKAPSILGMVGDAILPGNVISELISGNSQLSESDKQVALEKLRIERAEIDGTTKRWVADCLLYTSPSPRDQA